MIDTILKKKNATRFASFSVKTAIALAVIACAVVSPVLVHLFFGTQGGARLLPMFAPVLLSGFLLGKTWGLGVGILTPIASYLVTSACGNAMPTAEKLPYLILELAVIAFVSGVIPKAAKNGLAALGASACALIAGRASFLLLSLALGTASTALAQIAAGIPGALIAAVLVSLAVVLLKKGTRV